MIKKQPRHGKTLAHPLPACPWLTLILSRSVAGRLMHSSYWPAWLRSDTSRIRGVRGTVRRLDTATLILRVLVTVAGVVTPLGLYDALEPSDDVTFPEFEYRPDTSVFGLSTLPRTNLPFNRLCEATFANNTLLSYLAPCPSSDNQKLVVDWNGTTATFTYPNGYNNTVPAFLHDVFSSGTRAGPTTVSNFFDIQWRQYSSTTQGWYSIKPGNGSEYLYGTYGAIQPLFLDERYHVVEGLVVDTKTGALGFRNHTVPAGDQLSHGAVWSEDLLFVEPETKCVDTNLSLEFRVSLNSQTSTQFHEFFLVDNGGFVNLNQTYPAYDHDNAQNNPDLRMRAYKAAYLHNAWSMAYLNVTSLEPSWRYLNSKLGQKFPMKLENNALNYLVPRLSDFAPSWLLPGAAGGSGTKLNATYPNPFNVTNKNFESIRKLPDFYSCIPFMFLFFFFFFFFIHQLKFVVIQLSCVLAPATVTRSISTPST